MLKIGEFSKVAQVSIKALRHYDRMGLLKPAHIDRFTSYRYYALEQLAQLNRILALKDLGFSLDQIRGLLGEGVVVAELRGMLRLKQAEVQRKLLTEQVRLARVEARLKQIEEVGIHPEYEVVLKTIKSRAVIGLCETLPTWAQIGDLFERLYTTLRTLGIPSEAQGAPIAIYYDEGYQEQDVNVEVAVPCTRDIWQSFDFSNLTGVLIHDLRGAPTMACVVHQGRYEALGEAYSALLTWTQDNGYRVVGPNREVYLQRVGPEIEPENYITEIQIPVENILAALAEKQKEKIMEPKIVTKPAFTVVGLRYLGKNEKGEIPALWDQLGPRWGEFKNRASKDAFGVCSSLDDETGAFEYIAGIDVTDTSIVPEGMVSRDVAENTYAVFACTLKTISDTYEYVMQSWMPKSGYKWGDGADFELYDETFDGQDPTSTLYIYIPIKK